MSVYNEIELCMKTKCMMLIFIRQGKGINKQNNEFLIDKTSGEKVYNIL